MASALSPGSEIKLQSAHPSLISLVRMVAAKIPCMVVEAHRDEVAQHLAYESHHSTLEWPNSKHNHLPSLAVDLAPLPYNPNDVRLLYYFGGYVCATAQAAGIKIRWGGNWDDDLQLSHQKFLDLYHYELVLA